MASTFRLPSLAIGKSAFTRNRCELLWLTLEPQFRDECMSRDARAPEYKEADRQTGQQPVVSTPRARQGVTGHNVRDVLGFGTAAVVVALAIVYLIYVG
jgi:hypothetical protein